MASPARLPLALALLVLLPAPALRADGFGVYVNGARATGMGGAWVARVMDPSAVFYNVAGMSQCWAPRPTEAWRSCSTPGTA